MEFTMEWNVICRVCLQEGEMYSIFEKDEGDVLICEKIMQCSSIKIERGVNLPENICLKCLKDLRVAYSFRNNCESSDAVLQSFIKGNIVNDLVITTNGAIYKYKPPQGLKVKRIPKSVIKEEIIEEDGPQVEVLEDVTDYIDMEEDGQLDDPPPLCDEQDPEYEVSMKSDKNDNDTSSQVSDDHNSASGQDFVLIDDGTNVYTVKVGEEIGNESVELVNTTETLIDSECNQKENLPVVTTKSRNKSPAVRVPRQRGKGEKPMHICEICGNAYKHRHSLETHMRRHRNEKPFACEICGRAFVLNVELKCHMRTHTGQKPYPCRYCGRRFSDFGSRIKHERTHTGERPYACDTCGKAFAYSYGLTSHMLTHTGEKPFECEKCGKRFAKKHHLKNHLNTHAKQENRLRSKGPLPSPNVIINTTSNSGIGSSEDEYSSMLTVLTSDQHIEQTMGEYMNVNMVEIKEENGESATIEISDMPS